MTPSELKYQIETRGTLAHFFDRSAMKFFGDSMRNYGVCAAAVTTREAEAVECWELYRKRPVKHGLTASVFFNRETFERAYPA